MSGGRAEVMGFNAEIGLEIEEWEEGYCVMRLEIEPRHLNRAGVVHGGVLCTLIDAVTSHAGNYAADPAERPRAVTVSMAMQFVGQAATGTLKIVGTRTGGGRRLFFAHGEIFDDAGALVAHGDITGRIFL